VCVCGRVLHACGVRAVCASVCVWNALSECVMLVVCRPGVSMKILNSLYAFRVSSWCKHEDFE
jgi:hypothetical protein